MKNPVAVAGLGAAALALVGAGTANADPAFGVNPHVDRQVRLSRKRWVDATETSLPLEWVLPGSTTRPRVSKPVS
jgi:hypothetical protein